MALSESANLDRPRTRLDIPFTILNIAATAGVIVLPFFYFSVSSILAFLVMYTLCGLGLTAGYHRLFAHRSYTVPKWLERLIAISGYMAIQRGPIFWVAMHRLHHLYVDEPGKDPHTPKEGIWHVHFGWIHSRREDVWNPAAYRRLTPDLNGDPLYLWMDKETHDYAANICLVAASFVLGGFIGADFAGFDLRNGACFIVWVGLLNRVALLQAFGLINSVCHLVGTRPFQTVAADQSANNLPVALIIFGEGWHNNHHAFPTSARQGLRWYQFDVAWYLIWAMGRLGLATGIRIPSRDSIARKTRQPALQIRT